MKFVQNARISRRVKRSASVGLAAALSLSLLSGCTASSGSDTSGGSSAEKKIQIGVLQLVEHDALDASYKGFADGLKEAGYEDGKNIVLDFQNAQNEQANCTTIANKFVNDNKDLVLAIATPAAQAMATATKTIPILVTAVTDPAGSGLVASNDKPGNNVTGTSDLTPVAAQIDLIPKIVPDVKTVGLMYASSESNSQIQIDLAKKELDALGLKYVEGTVSNSNEIQQVAQSLVGKCEALYIPTDNMLAAGMSTVSLVTTPAKLPVIVGEESMVAKGGIATNGINYYNLGKQTATMAVKILKGESKPADMPIEYLTDTSLVLNQELAATIGITFPDELLNAVK